MANILATVGAWLEARIVRHYRYTGRHRPGRTPEPAVDWDAAKAELMADWIAADTAADPDLTAYRHTIGSRQYQRLKPKVLDAQMHADRKALALRTPWPPPRVLDEWAAEHEMAGAS